MYKVVSLIAALSFFLQVIFAQQEFYTRSGDFFHLTERGATHLSSLPLKCWEKEFPYKTGITFLDSSYVKMPRDYHPAFFGCYDWHSSVHGHWMLVKLLKQFPQLPEGAVIREKLLKHLSPGNIKKEMEIFKADNLSFERTYGWAWFLYLQKELLSWKDPLALQLSKNLKPMAKLFSDLWIKFLNKIVYPVRVGEHPNLAYGLSFTWDYAIAAGDTGLKAAIKQIANRFYMSDKNCPVGWEPGGTDFLSPCLEEAKLMTRLLDKPQYFLWIKKFMPRLLVDPSSVFKTAVVSDRTDGKLVHLDGLNFSRAACLYEVAKKLPASNAKLLRLTAARHIEAALPNVVSGSYAGEHWLGSFAVYALVE